jgi:Ca2+-binding RTX toxin-like protein
VLSANEISGSVTLFAVNLPSGAQLTDQGVLEIIGTPGSDHLKIGQQGDQIRVDASFLSSAEAFDLDEIESIHVILGAGNDHANIATNVTLSLILEGWSGNDLLEAGGGPATVLGGTGNDQLRAQIGAAILVGGGGNDRLTGGESRDILIGGDGNDVLFGNNDEDILIGGTTSYDVDFVALSALLDAWWDSLDAFDDRKLALETGVPSLHGTVKLVADRTVHDDGDNDQLFGGADDDWLWETS